VNGGEREEEEGECGGHGVRDDARGLGRLTEGASGAATPRAAKDAARLNAEHGGCGARGRRASILQPLAGRAPPLSIARHAGCV